MSKDVGTYDPVAVGSADLNPILGHMGTVA